MKDNVSAFLTMISTSEGTNTAPDPYRVCFAFRHTIADMSDHPAITGEWDGEPLDFLGRQYVGLKSTAAGRYQINRPTWLTCQKALNLPDFSPSSQDAAAVYLIKLDGAYDLVVSGQVSNAIIKCRHTWASLPGSNVGQPQRSFGDLVRAYTTAGGAFA